MGNLLQPLQNARFVRRSACCVTPPNGGSCESRCACWRMHFLRSSRTELRIIAVLSREAARPAICSRITLGTIDALLTTNRRRGCATVPPDCSDCVKVQSVQRRYAYLAGSVLWTAL